MSESYSTQTDNQVIFPVETNYNWNIPSQYRSELSSFACRFDAPFWATFEFHGDQRRVQVPNGPTITETLFVQVEEFYIYTAEGSPGINNYQGIFSITETGIEDQIRLTWAFSFWANTEEEMKAMLAINAGAVPAMTSQLAKHFPLFRNPLLGKEE